MSGSGRNKEDSESYKSQSPSPLGTAEPFYQKSVYELLLAGPNCQKAGWGEDGRVDEPG